MRMTCAQFPGAEGGGLLLVRSGYVGTQCLEMCLLTSHDFRSAAVVGSSLLRYALPLSADVKLDYALPHSLGKLAPFILRCSSWVDTLANAEPRVVGSLMRMVCDYHVLKVKEVNPESSNCAKPLRVRIADSVGLSR